MTVTFLYTKEKDTLHGILRNWQAVSLRIISLWHWHDEYKIVLLLIMDVVWFVQPKWHGDKYIFEGLFILHTKLKKKDILILINDL